MKRRTVLALAGSTVSAGISGCVSDSDDGRTDDAGTGDEDDDDTASSGANGSTVPEYADDLEECALVRIQYDSFPSEIQAEIDTALADGYYESDVLLFDRAVDAEDSYIVKDDTPYEPTVTRNGVTSRLELEAVDTILAPHPYAVSISNDGQKEHTLKIRIEDDTGTEKFDTSVTVGRGEHERRETTAQEFGSYTVSVELEDEDRSETEAVRIGDAYTNPFEIWITEDVIGVIQAVAELAPCPHEEYQ